MSPPFTCLGSLRRLFVSTWLKLLPDSDASSPSNNAAINMSLGIISPAPVPGSDPASDTDATKTTARPFILVPLYIYPSRDAWAPLLSAARQHPTLEFVVVVNPANGPGSGSAPDSNYIQVLQDLRSLPNIKLIGYVYCGWGKRPEAELECDIRAYKAWAGPEGCVRCSQRYTRVFNFFFRTV